MSAIRRSGSIAFGTNTFGESASSPARPRGGRGNGALVPDARRHVGASSGNDRPASGANSAPDADRAVPRRWSRGRSDRARLTGRCRRLGERSDRRFVATAATIALLLVTLARDLLRADRHPSRAVASRSGDVAGLRTCRCTAATPPAPARCRGPVHRDRQRSCGASRLGNTRASPVVADGVVYVAGTEALVAVDATTGAELWRPPSRPLVHAGHRGWGRLRRKRRAVRLRAERRRRQRALALRRDADRSDRSAPHRDPDSVIVYSAPVVVDGVVFVEAMGDIANDLIADLLAIDAATGEARWRVTLAEHRALSSPAVVDGVAYFATGAVGLVYALDAATGAERWHVNQVAITEVAAPAVADGVVYVGNNLGDLLPSTRPRAPRGGRSRPAASAPSNRRSPSLPASSTPARRPAGSSRSTRRRGARGGRSSSAAQPLASPALVDGVLYVNSQDGTVSAVDTGTGAVLWSVEAGGGYSSPAVVGGMIYLVDGDGFLVALGTPGQAMRDAN